MAEIFTLIGYCCVTNCQAVSPSQDFYVDTADVRGVIGENISLTCNVPTGLWKYDGTINKMWLLPEHYSGDAYLFSFNSSGGLNTLYIYNINERLGDLFTCFCDDYNRTRTIHACFNLSVLQCPISVLINGEKHVLDRCGLKSKAEIVDVEVNENITIKCDDEANRRTNCLHIGQQISFMVDPSHHLCCLSCRPKNDGVELAVSGVILNIMNKVILTSTAEMYTEMFSSTETHFIGDVTSKLSPDQRWLIIIVSSSLSFAFGFVALSTCAYVLFNKIGVCTSPLQYNTQSAGDVYNDVVEIQSPDTSSFHTRHIDHRTDLGDNDVILSDIDDITKDVVSLQFYNDPDAHFTVNRVGHKVSIDGAVGTAVYSKVQKTPVEMKCTMSNGPNTGDDMDTFTDVAL